MIVKNQTGLLPRNDYPTSDGKPMAETDHHRKLMNTLIETLEEHFSADPQVYASGNLLLFYEKGDKRRHVAPDVFVVRGVAKGLRPNYLMWEEKSPDVVIELTSKTTRSEDTTKKWSLYQDVLKVKEYFLFDPYEDYLDPAFQGFVRVRGKFKPLDFADGRLPSLRLGLHLYRVGTHLRLWDPVTKLDVPTPAERIAAEAQRANAEAQRADAEAQRANSEAERAKIAESEVERLRRELEQLRGKPGGK